MKGVISIQNDKIKYYWVFEFIAIRGISPKPLGATSWVLFGLVKRAILLQYHPTAILSQSELSERRKETNQIRQCIPGEMRLSKIPTESQL